MCWDGLQLSSPVMSSINPQVQQPRQAAIPASEKMRCRGCEEPAPVFQPMNANNPTTPCSSH